MKFNYDLSDNYKKLYDEANGILRLKNKLLKNEKTKIKTFTNLSLNMFFKIEIFGLILLLLSNFIKLNVKGINIFMLVSVIYLILGFIFLIVLIKVVEIAAKDNINSAKGILEFKKDGILDKSEKGINVLFLYENIELIVITENIIVFIIKNSNVIIFIPNENKENIIKTIKENANVKIIDKQL